MSIVEVRKYKDLTVNKKEILRYAGDKTADGEVLEIMEDCLKQAFNNSSFMVCFSEFSVNIKGDLCDFGVFSVNSADLAKNLAGCRKVVIFAATVGVGIDRFIAKYGRISPLRAVLFDAVGSAFIESLCDCFCEKLSEKDCIKPRFSPGYGDLPLAVQKTIFDILNPQKNI